MIPGAILIGRSEAMPPTASYVQWILSALLIASALGVITARKPLYASLSFLASLMMLAALYLQLSASFIAVMQVLVYAGAILVIFTFVIVLFQDAYQQIARHPAKSMNWFLIGSALAFSLALIALGRNLIPAIPTAPAPLQGDFGTVQALGRALYVDFFFPFEAVVLLFLIALIGALYLGKKSLPEG